MTLVTGSLRLHSRGHDYMRARPTLNIVKLRKQGQRKITGVYRPGQLISHLLTSGVTSHAGDTIARKEMEGNHNKVTKVHTRYQGSEAFILTDRLLSTISLAFSQTL